MPIRQKQAPLFLFLRKENRKMTRFFERGTALAEMERQMMMAPNFTPRSNGSAVLCRYRSAAADVDCQSCVRRRRQSRQGLTCLHLTKRLQAGMVTVAELAAETVRPWKHLGLKQRTMGIAGRAGGCQYSGLCPLPDGKRIVRGRSGRYIGGTGGRGTCQRLRRWNTPARPAVR